MDLLCALVLPQVLDFLGLLEEAILSFHSIMAVVASAGLAVLLVLTAAVQELKHKYRELIKADFRNACALLKMMRLCCFGM